MKRLSAGYCLSMLTALLAIAAPALAAPAPGPQPTTQKATISPTAFDPADDAVTPEIAKAVESKRVSLKVQNMPALAAMQEIAKQTGYEIRPGHEQWFTGRQRGSNVTLDIQYQPFWVAIREITSRGNITLYNSGGEMGRAVQLAPGNFGYSSLRHACSIRGPFLVVVGHLQRINTVNMARPDDVTRNVQIQINTFVEPSVSIAQASYQAFIEEAVDNHGNSMVPPNQSETNRHMQGGRGISWHGNFSLPYPVSNPGTRIARVKGYLPATLNLATEPVVIDDPLKSAETSKTAGKRKVTFKSLKKQNQSYLLELTFYRDGGDQRQMHEMFNETIVMKLTDAQGREYRYHNSGGQGGGDSIIRRFTFQPPRNTTGAASGTAAEPVKLVIEVPTGREEIAIPFELVDLPLP